MSEPCPKCGAEGDCAAESCVIRLVPPEPQHIERARAALTAQPLLPRLGPAPEHDIGGETCWCGPRIERYAGGDVIIHNEEAHQ